MKTTRIASGYYEFKHKGQLVKIIRTEIPHENYKSYWYCQINESEVNDYNSSKKKCIDSAIYMIDNAKAYGLILNN